MPARAPNAARSRSRRPASRENGAATTGLAAYFNAILACWKRWMARFSSSHSPSCAASSTIIRLAPTLKFSPSLAMTMASKFFVGFLHARVHHGDIIFAKRVHLAVELDAQHAVAQIDQRGSRVLLHHAAARFRSASTMIPARCSRSADNVRAENRNTPCAAGRRGRPAGTTKTAPASSIFWMFSGSARLFAFQPRDDILEAQRIPQLERTQLIGVAPAHGAIDFDDAIRNLRNHLSRVERTDR